MPELTVTCLPAGQGIDPVRFTYPARHMRVRELIAQAVREQCSLLTGRQGARAAHARLAARSGGPANSAQIAHAAIAAAASSCALPLDPDAEVAKALAAFEEGGFLVLVGSQRCSALDQTISLELAQPVQFIRMIALTGG